MQIVAESLDDLFSRVFERLLSSKTRVRATRGETIERIGVLLKLKNPRARLSRTESRGKVFSALGELLWYLSGSNKMEHIAYYLKKYRDEAEDDGTVWGAYGPRLVSLHGKHNQIQNVCELLKINRTSRRAVVQLFDGGDIANPHLLECRKKEIPCTCTLQFLVRKDRLHMFTSMRSNDAYFGLQHDVFAFTMMQELVARAIGIELGSYHHFVGSLHLYDRDFQAAGKFMDEGWQANLPMPAMPNGDQWENVEKLISVEKRIRLSKKAIWCETKLPGYWDDLARLLYAFRLLKKDDQKGIGAIRQRMHSKVFNTYLQPRKKRPVVAGPLSQPSFDLPPSIASNADSTK
ncbi:MAG: thymidylate synthase [Verrucomicrobiaceae bacterium]|nr:thymidylate synthase [Verrucomicrobiaceae bacterium]